MGKPKANFLTTQKQTRRKTNVKSPKSAFYFKTLPNLIFLNKDLQNKLESIIQSKINDPKIFEIAFIHKSYLVILQKEYEELKLNETYTNERLEFLGDSIFNSIITEYIFEFYPNKNEGDLTALRSKLINRQVLGAVAYKLNLDEFIQVSNNVRHLIKSKNTSVLSNTLEALVGAIYIDLGYEAARNFVLKIVLPLLSEIHAFEIINFKSELMEKVQSLSKPAPIYNLLAEEGPSHQKTFFIGVYIGGELWGTALGNSKKETEQIAAKNALELTNLQQ